MKKLWISLVLMAASTLASALPLGNPTEASYFLEGIFWDGYNLDHGGSDLPCTTNTCDAWSLRLGFYGDYVWDRGMEVKRNSSHITNTKLTTNAAYIVFNLRDKVDIFGTIGATSITLIGTGQSFGLFTPASSPEITIKPETYFSWSLGARTTIWKKGCFGVGVESQYFQSRPKLNYLAINFTDPIYFPTGERLVYKEWQFGVGASYRLNLIDTSTALIPYVGIKTGNAWINMDDVPVVTAAGIVYCLDLRQNRPVGYALGITLLAGDRISASVEGRFVNEKALYINSQLRF